MQVICDLVPPPEFVAGLLSVCVRKEIVVIRAVVDDVHGPFTLPTLLFTQNTPLKV